MEALPAADRAASLRTLALGWQPFVDAQVVVGQRGAWGIAVAWDRAALAEQLRVAGCAPQRLRLLPEPLLQPPMQHGLRLLRGIDGCEAQYWHGGMLRVTRWWPEAPDATQWLEFERLLPDAEEVDRSMPDLQSPLLLASPWLPMHSADAEPGAGRSFERLSVGVGLVCLTAASAAIAHQAWEAHRVADTQHQELQALHTRSAPLLKTRDSALALQAEAAIVAAAMSAPLPIEVLQHLSQLLRTGVVAQEIELSGSQLRLVLEVPAALPQSTLIRELQAGQWIQAVREVKGGTPGQALQLEMRLAGLRPPAAANVPAASMPATSAPGTPDAPSEAGESPSALPPGLEPPPAVPARKG